MTAPRSYGGIFDFDSKQQRLTEVQRELEQPELWNNPQRAQELGRERAKLESEVGTLTRLRTELTHSRELLELARAEGDADVATSVAGDVDKLEKELAGLEFRRMFSGEMDANNAFLDIQSGSGGTEAQDWANMLLRMYLMWGDRRAPPGAQTPVRFRQPPPYLVCLGFCLSRGRGKYRGGHQPRRSAHRHLPRERRRGPACQPDRFRYSHHAHSDRDCGSMPV